MIRNLLTALLLFSVQHSTAQMMRGYTSLSAGVTLPFATFASTSSTDSSAGYATPGIYFGISGRVNIAGAFGITSKLTFTSFGTDDDELTDNANLNAPFGTFFTVEAANYASGTFLIGPSVSVPLTYLLAEVRLMGGVALSHYPEIKTSYNLFGIETNFQSEQATAFGPALSMGLGIQIPVTPRLGIHLNGNLHASYADFGTIRLFETITGFTISQDEVESSYQYSSVSLGVAYLFQEK